MSYGYVADSERDPPLELPYIMRGYPREGLHLIHIMLMLMLFTI